MGGNNAQDAAGRGRATIGVFGKHWTPGATKTRLAASVGPEAAASASRYFLETTLERLGGLEIGGRRCLEYAPSDSGDAFATLAQDVAGDWILRAQADGDLGHRMQVYFERSLAVTHAAVLVGSDSPHLPLDAVQQACDWLTEETDQPRCVLGPTEDGGYWLIGASLAPPPIFDGMPWSESDLLSATTERLRREGWSEGTDYRLLRSWYDVDELDDLTRMRRSLAEQDDSALKRLAVRLDELFGPLPR